MGLVQWHKLHMRACMKCANSRVDHGYILHHCEYTIDLWCIHTLLSSSNTHRLHAHHTFRGRRTSTISTESWGARTAEGAFGRGLVGTCTTGAGRAGPSGEFKSIFGWQSFMHAGAVNRSSLAVMSKVINSALSHIAAYESDTIAALVRRRRWWWWCYGDTHTQ